MPNPSERGPFRRRLRSRLVSGLAVLVPIGITLLALRFFLDAAAGLAHPLTHRFLGEWPWFARALFSLSILVILVYVVGEIAAHVVGRRLIALGEALLLRIPLVRPIYGASKQVIQSFSLPDAAQIQSVVFVEFPRPGMRALGFLTGTVELDDGIWYKVFLPTTPNPTSGYFQLVRPSETWTANLAVEDGIKIIMSAGVLTPARLSMLSAE
jgi:uncharacterized membrane protein